LKGEYLMATSSKTSSKAKAPKAEKNEAIHDANATLVALGVDLIKNELGTEIAIYEQLVSDLNLGNLSVRGAKATISAINAEAGSLPSIAVTSCQYLILSNVVRNLEGGKAEPVKDIINLTIQGTRKLGAEDFAGAIKKATSFSALAKVVEKAPKKENAKGAKTVDQAMSQFIKAMENITNIKPQDAGIAGDFLNLASGIQGAMRAAHPAVQARKSA
jgi:hypothetical protein